MAKRQVSYVHDGDTFIGDYRITAHGGVASMSVSFHGLSISARLGGLKEETVARTLLGELVRERFGDLSDGRQHPVPEAISVRVDERDAPAGWPTDDSRSDLHFSE